MNYKNLVYVLINIKNETFIFLINYICSIRKEHYTRDSYIPIFIYEKLDEKINRIN
jgi:hypothetical protein